MCRAIHDRPYMIHARLCDKLVQSQKKGTSFEVPFAYTVLPHQTIAAVMIAIL